MNPFSPHRPLRRRLYLTLSVLILLLIAPYFLIPHYDFPAAPAFSGSAWYNPYAGGFKAEQKVCFHLHSHAWGGVTDGHTAIEQIDSVYRAYGYNNVSLSNYFRIDTLQSQPAENFIPCYEQGFSIQKSHRLVVGAKGVQWLDVLTPQTRSIKQFFFSRLHPSCDVLVMAHPAFGRPSYTLDDARELCDYDCMEVLNHYTNSLAHWDAALSAGHPAWLIADDDSHNALNDHETAVRWTLVLCPDASRAFICSALKRGAALGVMGRHASCDIRIDSLRVSNDSLYLSTNKAFKHCRCIVQNGRVAYDLSNTSTLHIPLRAEDHYYRLEIEGDSSTVFTNPIIRADLQPLRPSVRIDAWITALYVLIYTLLVLSLTYFAIKALRVAQNA